MQESFKYKVSTKTENQPINLIWADNLSAQELLDVVASIIADEYIEIAKKNKDVFSSKGTFET